MGESTTITHAMLTIVALVLAAVFAVAVMGRLGYLQSTLSDLVRIKTDQVQTNVKIITGFYNSTEGAYIVYLKNLGPKDIPFSVFNNTDIYLGPYGGNVLLYVYGNGSTGTWTASDIGGDNIWNAGETAIIKVYTGVEYSSSVYIKVVLPSGADFEEVIPG
jgi:flagellar protein FlaG